MLTSFPDRDGLLTMNREFVELIEYGEARSQEPIFPPQKNVSLLSNEQ